MKKIILTLVFLLQVFLADNLFSQILFDENFDYPAGDSIGAHGWTWNTGTTNNIMVVSPGLIFPSYPLSGIGNACRLRNNGFDAYKPVSLADSAGNLYTSFMVNLDSVQANGGDYFFALLPSNSTTNYTARLYVKDTTGGVVFGMTKGAIATNPVTWSTTTYLKNTTYLIVVKYTFLTGSTTDDEIRVYIFSSVLPSTEPSTPTIGPVTGPATDAPNIGRVALRQGSASIAPTLKIDGIRVGKTWGNITSVQNISSGVPSEFSLEQNYPNPFNPETNIEFSIPKASFVTLSVYDILGREIEKLVNDNLSAGQYNVRFNASNYPSGVYFYKIEAPGFSKTNKMLIIK